MACCNKPLVSAYCFVQVHPNTISVERYATNYKVQWNHKQRSIKTFWWCGTQSGYQQWSNYQGKWWRRILRSHCWRIQPVQIRWLSKRTEIQWGMKYDSIKDSFEAKNFIKNWIIMSYVCWYLFFRKDVMTRDANVIILLMSIRVAGSTTFMTIWNGQCIKTLDGLLMVRTWHTCHTFTYQMIA